MVKGKPVKHKACKTILFWITTPAGVVFWCPSCRCTLEPQDDQAQIYIEQWD